MHITKRYSILAVFVFIECLIPMVRTELCISLVIVAIFEFTSLDSKK